jgi:hypothetical protein
MGQWSWQYKKDTCCHYCQFFLSEEGKTICILNFVLLFIGVQYACIQWTTHMHSYACMPFCVISVLSTSFSSLFLILFLEQVLSVAVYNHYKRIYLESVKKWLVLFLRPPCVFGLSFIGSSKASE